MKFLSPETDSMSLIIEIQKCRTNRENGCHFGSQWHCICTVPLGTQWIEKEEELTEKPERGRKGSHAEQIRR